MVQDEDKDKGEEEAWEWVHLPPCRLDHNLQVAADGDCDGWFSSREDEAPAGLLTTNGTQSSESLSSSTSSPILKHGLAVTVMAKELISALDAPHNSATEWIEPQLVFSRQQGLCIEGFEICNVVTYLQNLPKAKEALLSLLSDPGVCDAVIQNKAFQELTYDYKDSDPACEGQGLNPAPTPSSLYKRGKKAYKLLKQKLTIAVDVLLSLLGRDTLERNVVNQLDATVKSCILLVALLIFSVIGKRSNEGLCLART